MTTQLLEQRLREKFATETPRPGFETRIQAMAREPYVPEKKSLMRRVAVPALAVVAIGAVLNPKDKSPQQPIAATPAPVIEPIEEPAMAAIEEPVQREIQGLKNDAKWTMGLFQKALPSLPVKKDEGDKER